MPHNSGNISIIGVFPDYTNLARSVTAPATTGEATLVPERERHPSFIPDPRTPEP